jgi:hypothetical protein
MSVAQSHIPRTPGVAAWWERAAWHAGALWDRFTLGEAASHVYRWTRVPEPPEELMPFVVYVVGQGGHQWSAELLCPCDCGATIRLSLHPDGRPRWLVVEHTGGRATLRPSVWRGVGCRSHFTLTAGHVKYY